MLTSQMASLAKVAYLTSAAPLRIFLFLRHLGKMGLKTDILKIPSLHDMLVKVHGDLFTVDRYTVFVGFEGLSTLEKMVVLLEDRRFFGHRGVDFRSVAREIVRVVTFKKHGGASTIDMQFVRTATGYRERTLRRKIYEILISVIIQFKYTKLQILRSYLNCAFFGSGLIGARAACESVFQKSVDQLTPNEAAFIAAMLVCPKPLVPKDAWFRRVDRRAIYARNLFERYEKSFDKVPTAE